MTSSRPRGLRALRSEPRSEFRSRLGANLRELRRAQGLSQDELSRMVGTMTQSSISNYEAGRRELTLSDAIVLCHALSVGLYQLLGNDVVAVYGAELDAAALQKCGRTCCD